MTFNANWVWCKGCGNKIDSEKDRFFLIYEERLNGDKKKRVIGHFHPECWKKTIKE